ncbi:MAG: hypothetical protein K2W95_34135 [Candidatus Obscuribacterales bacterium]|nr:hypothetical protein [Candidatus Obscuribacterales bacterium]
MKLQIERSDLDWAARSGLIDADQVDGLWSGLASRLAPAPAPDNKDNGFSLQQLLWYSGAGIVISAMAWFLLQAFELFSGGGILTLSLLYGAGFLAIGSWFNRKPDLKTPGGLLITLAVGMVPLAVFGVEHMAGMWTPSASMQRDIEPIRNLLMEGALVVAGLLAIRYVRFPFLGLPVAAGAWLITLDLVRLAAGVNGIGVQTQQVITVGFGALMIIASTVIDRRSKQDYAMWGYFFGVAAFWFGLAAALFFSNGTGGLFNLNDGAAWGVWCIANIGLLFSSVLLRRRVLQVYGSFGVLGYLGYLTFSVFADSPLFPLYLIGLGVGVIGLGVVYQVYAKRIESAIHAALPESLRNLLPPARD